MTATTRSEEGFALVVVIGVALILSAILIAFSHTVQQRLQAVTSLARSAEAEAAADAGIAIAAQELALMRGAGQTPGRLAGPGSAFSCSFGAGADVVIGVQDAAGLVNINLAEEPLLRALFIGAGESEASARQLAARLMDYRDPDGEPMPEGGEAAAYAEAGLGHGPRNGPLQSIGELGAVLGFTPDLAGRLAPYVTVLSDRPGLDPFSVPKELRSILTTGLAQVVPGASFDRAGGLPLDLVSPGSANVFRATITAHLASGASFTRVADLDMRGDPSRPPRLRTWTRRVLDAAPARPDGTGALPPC